MFFAGKTGFLTHREFCAYHRIFGIRKGHDYLYQLFNVLPRQTTFEMKARQVAIQIYIQQRFHDVDDVACSSFSHFSGSRVRGFGIANLYS